jgi:hypothetical protein
MISGTSTVVSRTSKRLIPSIPIAKYNPMETTQGTLVANCTVSFFTNWDATTNDTISSISEAVSAQYFALIGLNANNNSEVNNGKNIKKIIIVSYLLSDNGIAKNQYNSNHHDKYVITDPSVLQQPGNFTSFDYGVPRCIHQAINAQLFYY